MAINWISCWNVGMCRAAADAQRHARATWQGWLDSGLGPTGEPMPPAAVPQLRRWVVEADVTAADWDRTGDALEARVGQAPTALEPGK